MRPVTPIWLLACAAACTVGPGGSFPDGGATAATTVSSTAPTSATQGSDGSGETGASDSAASSSADTAASAADTTGDTGNTDTGTGDASTSPGSGTESSESGAGTSLDPLLDVPDVGEQCESPGDLQSCPGIAVCRFATAEYGLCESCDACGNLNAACVEGTDCDILFSCYAGRCTNFCTLGESECGPVDACLDVGHPTRGVCDPFA